MAERTTEARSGPDIGDLSERQRRALTALLEAKNAKEAAAQAGVSERQMKRYRADPTFRAVFKAAQRDMLEEVAHNARTSMTSAITTLTDIALDSGAPAASRVTAARSLVEFGIKLVELTDISERLTELEKWREAEDG